MTKNSFGDIAKRITKDTSKSEKDPIPVIRTKPVGESYVSEKGQLRGEVAEE